MLSVVRPPRVRRGRAPGPSPSSARPPGGRRRHRPGRVGAPPRRRPRHRRRPAGPRRRPRRARRHPRPHHPGPGHHHPGDLPGRRHRRRPAAADAARVDRGVRRADPPPDHQRRRRGGGRRPRPGAVPRPAVEADGADRAARRAGARRRPGRRRRRGGGRPTIPSGWPSSSSRAARPPRPRASCSPTVASGPTSTPSSPARGISDADRAVSWLPLYHDMGLIGLLMTPMLHRLRAGAGRAAGLPRRARRTGWSGSPSTAARSPPARTSRTRSPRARCARGGELDLSSWRLALNGAETVDPTAVEAFCAAAASPRLRRPGRVPRLRHGRGDPRRDLPRGRARG